MRAQLNLRNAKRDGMLIIQPKRNQLQIDIDSARDMHNYCRQYMLLSREGLTVGWKERMTVSKGGGNHFHITITMPHRIDDLKRVAYQTVLGDDLKRAAFNLCRVIKRNKYPIVFFEKGKHARVSTASRRRTKRT